MGLGSCRKCTSCMSVCLSVCASPPVASKPYSNMVVDHQVEGKWVSHQLWVLHTFSICVMMTYYKVQSPNQTDFKILKPRLEKYVIKTYRNVAVHCSILQYFETFILQCTGFLQVFRITYFSKTRFRNHKITSLEILYYANQYIINVNPDVWEKI